MKPNRLTTIQKNQYKYMKYLSLIIIPTLLFGCSKPEISISAICKKDSRGNYTIKWEIFPEEDDAIIEIFASNNDSIFPEQPIKKIEANQFITIIEDPDTLGYSYFKLKVNDTYSNIITNQIFDLGGIDNFRDLGGYETSDGKRIKWKKIFRSGDLSQLTESDQKTLKSLKIQSIVDFRALNSKQQCRDKFSTPYRYELYIEGPNNDSIKKEVIANNMLRGDAMSYMQNVYESMLLKDSEEYAHFFDLLTDESNYPILFHCSLGKDQSGIAAYFLLRALGVSTDIAEDDYKLSGETINKQQLISDIEQMTETQQEALTTLTHTDISYLKYALACAKKSEGSIDEYMEKRLKLTKEKKQKLREIMLY